MPPVSLVMIEFDAVARCELGVLHYTQDILDYWTQLRSNATLTAGLWVVFLVLLGKMRTGKKSQIRKNARNYKIVLASEGVVVSVASPVYPPIELLSADWPFQLEKQAPSRLENLPEQASLLNDDATRKSQLASSSRSVRILRRLQKEDDVSTQSPRNGRRTGMYFLSK